MTNNKLFKRKNNPQHQHQHQQDHHQPPHSPPHHRHQKKDHRSNLLNGSKPSSPGALISLASHSADDSYIQRLPSSIISSQDSIASTLTTPRRPSEKNSYLTHTLSLNPSSSTSSPDGKNYGTKDTSRYERIMSPLKHKDRQGQEKSHNTYPSLPSEWMKTPLRPPPITIPKTESSHTSTSTSYIPPLSDDSTFSFHKFSWKKFLLAEMFGIGDPGHLEPMAVETIDNFLSVPWELEKLLFFGFIITIDSFLYTITYLPIRFLLAVILLFDEIMGYLLTFRPLTLFYLLCTTFNFTKSYQYASTYISHHHKYQFEYSSSRQFDLMRGLLLLIGSWALSHVNMSWVYHYIRMQNTIKLYALTAMMEIFDKLFSSFGIDALDSLFWKTRIRSNYTVLILSFLVTLIYVLVHSSLYFTHVSTLIVAINNADQSLLTILILNNFAEIKSFVLKKFDEDSFYQLVCSDIYERFKIVLFYFLIFLIGFSQSSNIYHTFLEYGLIFLWMLFSEMIVDWIKHAFIIKLNHNKLSPKSYKEYHKQLRYDIFYGQKDKITLDHSYSVTKTLGIAQFPLGCIFFRFIMIALYSSKNTERLNTLTMYEFIGGICLILCGLVLLKVIISMGLIYYIGMKNNSDRQEEIERKNKEIHDLKKWEEIKYVAELQSISNVDKSF